MSVLGRPAAGVTERDARNPRSSCLGVCTGSLQSPHRTRAGGRGASGAPGSPSLSSTRRLPVLPLWPSGVTAGFCEAWSRTAAWAPLRLRLPASPLSWGRSPFLRAGLPGCCSLKTPPSGGLSRPLSQGDVGVSSRGPWELTIRLVSLRASPFLPDTRRVLSVPCTLVCDGCSGCTRTSGSPSGGQLTSARGI